MSERPIFGNAGTTMPNDWRALAEAYGGVDALRERLMVSRATLWRYAQGRAVPRPMRFLVEQLAHAEGVRTPRMTLPAREV